MFNGMEEKTITTNRLEIAYLEAGDPQNQPVLLVHGNVSSGVFWLETIKALADKYWVIAPDMRGYGKTEAKGIDATRGLRDWSDDLLSLLEALEIKEPIHLTGWSLGGGIIMQFMIDNPQKVASLTLINPISPYGFGGSKGENGTPINANYSGSGGGGVNQDFIKLLSESYRGDDNPNAPLNVLNNHYFKSPFRVSQELEEIFLSSMSSTKIGPLHYPGDFETCLEWPGVSPGVTGINNAFSAKYMDVSAISDVTNKVPILWIRGSDDIIVSDTSLYDFGFLGKCGFVPDWPGEDVYPPQPMVSQMRYVLEQYKAKGGSYEEIIVPDTGHSPHIEKAQIVHDKIHSFLASTQ
ncbi:MAG: alpha/beta hydrolase [Peptococcia bacterium]